MLTIASSQVAAAKCIYLNAVKNLYPQWLEQAKLRLEANSHRCVSFRVLFQPCFRHAALLKQLCPHAGLMLPGGMRSSSARCCTRHRHR